MLELLSCLLSPVSFFLLINPSSLPVGGLPSLSSSAEPLSLHTLLSCYSAQFSSWVTTPRRLVEVFFFGPVYVPRQKGSVNVMMDTLQWDWFSSGAREVGGESGSPSSVNMCCWSLRNSEAQRSGTGTFHFSYVVGGYLRPMASIMAVHSATSGRRYRMVC